MADICFVMVRGTALTFVAISLFLQANIVYPAADVQSGRGAGELAGERMMEQSIRLPKPRRQGTCAVEEALERRRSSRAFTGAGLSLADIGQLLWAAQGITHAEGFRTAPSAGALYPLELYFVAGDVEGLEPGVYHYGPQAHTLRLNRSGDVRTELADAAFGQDWVGRGAAVLVVAAVQDRTAGKYGPRAARYVAIEVGHAAENVALQAVSLGLGIGFVGAFDDGAVKDRLRLGLQREPMYLLPLGRPRTPIRCGEGG